MSERAERVRLFVALDLPREVRESLGAWGREQAGRRDGVRVLPPALLHVTLCFLGWQAATDAGRIGRVSLAQAASVPDLAVGGAAWLPPRRPRVLVADLEDGAGALGELQRRVGEALAAEVGWEPEHRPFRPHVTVARVGKGARVDTGDLANPPRQGFAGSALTLYRSNLRRDGARYEPLASARLTSAGA